MHSWTALALLLRPLILVAFFGTCMLIARGILRLIPSGRVRNVLTREVDWGRPSTEANRRSWFSVLVWLTFVVFIVGGALLLDHFNR